MGQRAEADSHQGQRSNPFPRQQAEDMTAPETFTALHEDP